MGSLGWPEILIILLVIVLLFGAAKLPTLARSAGRSMRIFKSEMNEMKNDGKPSPVEGAVPPAADTVVPDPATKPATDPVTDPTKKNQA
ncbi:Sec-independent protein translocase subunit TatA [Corynebacterium kalidii]|uniref:Sec-independent protein translocase protein TatA n=1 Tax=Corynebacterium kalidii TaxID=2931982 RepID=A0A9X2B321_9CORY|nr:Sec-independent protein translocase subunit TatA [Corynebacterium kalidii]MCJ7859724.1 Sec-independent protein translocase subunit TatA [Corynebacterium kalidii]